MAPVQGKGTIELLTPPIKLVAESYAVHVGIWDPRFHELMLYQSNGVFPSSPLPEHEPDPSTSLAAQAVAAKAVAT